MSSSDVSVAAKRLIYHGAAIILIGCLVSGVLYEIAAIDKEKSENAFRTAHSGTISNGLLVMVVGAAQPYLTVSANTRSWISTLFVVAGWGNAIGYNLAAATGVRGLIPVCFTKTPPYLYCPPGEELFNIPPNVSFVIAAGAVTAGLYLVMSGTSDTSAPITTGNGGNGSQATSARSSASREVSWGPLAAWVLGAIMYVQVVETIIPNLSHPHVFDWHLDLAALVFGPREDVEYQFARYHKHWITFNGHMVTGSLWVIILTLQWQAGVRRWSITFHRWLGRLGLLVSVLSVIPLFHMLYADLAFHYGETIASAFWGAWWLYSGYKAWVYARAHKVADHKRWVVRMTAISCNTSVLRIIFVAWNVLGFTSATRQGRGETFSNMFWVSGILSILLGEMYINAAASGTPDKKKKA